MQNLPATPRVIWMALGAALLAGCTTVGPNFKTPQAPGVQQYTRQALPTQTASAPGILGAAQQFQTVQSISPDWWRSYGSASLDGLVATALRSSPTLAAAEAALRQAQQTYAAQAGSTLYPTVDGKLGASRNQTNAASVGQGSSATNIFILYNASIAVN